jgi:transcriptional regulator with XRE-family HTH domain
MALVAGLRAMISGAQIRAARALLGWTAKDLAQKAKVGVSTVQRIENAEGTPNVHVANLAAIQSALEAAGIEFTNGDAPGLRLHRKKSIDND